MEEGEAEDEEEEMTRRTSARVEMERMRMINCLE